LKKKVKKGSKQNILYTSSLLLITTHTYTTPFLSLLEKQLENEARKK